MPAHQKPCGIAIGTCKVEIERACMAIDWSTVFQQNQASANATTESDSEASRSHGALNPRGRRSSKMSTRTFAFDVTVKARPKPTAAASA